MPTGYTAGIIDGDIKDFKEYAVCCTRAFGAGRHMQEFPNSKEIKDRTPDVYSLNKISILKKELDDLNSSSDDELLIKWSNTTNSSIKHYEESIIKANKSEAILNEFLAKAKAFIPPTPAHREYKKFMIEQLESTIKFDCGTKYLEDNLEELHKELKNPPDANTIRENRLNQINKDIQYYKSQYQEELDRCNEGNKWVKELMKSLGDK